MFLSVPLYTNHIKSSVTSIIMFTCGYPLSLILPVYPVLEISLSLLPGYDTLLPTGHLPTTGLRVSRVAFVDWVAYFSDSNALLTYRGRIFRRLSWDWL